MNEKTLINAYQKSYNTIRHIYLQNGKIHKEDVAFKPFLGVYSGEKTSWTDMYGSPVKVRVFDSISDMQSWKKENKDSISILGDVAPTIQFIASTYRKEIPFSKDGLKIFNIDIEVFADCFPKPTESKFPINAITVNEMVKNTYTTFGTGIYYPDVSKNETYIQCMDEADLLEKFLTFWSKEDPQIITGWNIVNFDIPYLVNRIGRTMGAEAVHRLSKDRKVSAHEHTDTSGEKTVSYSLQGHIIWDYYDLYQKYTMEKRESYSLDNISKVELGDEKINYHDEYENLSDLYLKDYEKFITYNIKDTNLVYQLNEKLAYIDLALTIMHKAKCQPEQIYKTVGPWDCIMYNELLSRKMLCPPNNGHMRQDFIGGYVAEPVAGLYNWTEVVDIVSSYPNQDISGNFSPETIIPDNFLTPALSEIRSKYTGIDICADIRRLDEIAPILREHNVSFSSNGYFYDISREGIIPSIFAKFFKQRKEYKAQLKEHKKAGRTQEARIADLFQYTVKILLNSGYGFLSNIHSRYFDIRIAEAITSNGQVCCKGAIKAVTDRYSDVKCIYADTDSNFYALDKLVEKRFKDKNPSKAEVLDFILQFDKQCLAPVIDDFFKTLATNMNFRVNTIKMEAECVADATLFVAKKRYIMNKIWDEGEFLLDKPKRKIRGVEIVRSSTPMIVRNRLKEAVDLIFTTLDNKVLVQFISDFKKEFYTLPIETIAFPRGVTFSNYTEQSKGLPIGVKSAFAFNRLLKMKGLDTKYQPIQDGDKIKFCYIKTPNPLRSHVIGFINKLPIELVDEFKIDYDEQFIKTFLNPIQGILNAIKWHSEEQNSLEDWF